jgi:GntR family transcriptional repressor for pyruvate dehydrogenase complex
MEFARISRPRAYREVVDQVVDALISGDLRIGDKLPPEREIAAQLGISRTSVREAMRVLADSGLVKRKPGPGGGTSIATDVVPRNFLTRAIELSHKRITDLLEVRSVLELTSAELAAARADPDQVRILDEIAQEAQALAAAESEEAALFTTLDPRFHVTLARGSQNEVLVTEIRSINKQVVVAVEMTPLGVEYGALEASTIVAVVEAVKRRNPQEARMAMHHHLSPMPPLVDMYFGLQ